MSELAVESAPGRGRDLRRVFRYGAQSGISFFLGLAIPWMLVEQAGTSPELAVLVSFVSLFAINFLGCRYVVFKASAMPFLRQLLAFATFSAGFRIAEYLVFLLLNWVSGAYYLYSLSAILVVSFLVKYFALAGGIFRIPRMDGQA